MQKTLLALIIACSFHLTGNAQKLPGVIILATGGNIAGKGSNPDRAAYESGKIPIQDLLIAIPSINKPGRSFYFSAMENEKINLVIVEIK